MNWQRHTSGKKALMGCLLMIGSAFFLGGCYYDNEEELYPDSFCDSGEVTYSETIAPLLSTHCYSCHGNSNTAGANTEVRLEGYVNVKQYIDNGLLLSAVKHDGNASPMPEDGQKLSNCQIRQIEEWITKGAPND